jgi:vacuolar-type H+-ATPase subunit H
MEELQSTEALDREILEDARKKAFKILKNADESVSASKTALEKKLQNATEKARKSYAEKAETARREIMARLPMDKRRIRSEAINSFLGSAIEHFLGTLDRPSLLRILEKELALRADSSLSGMGEFRYRSLSAAECSALGSAAFPGLSFSYMEDSLPTIGGAFPALMIDFPQLKITASADKAAETLLLDKRVELASALLGNLEDLTVDSGTPIMRSLTGQAGGANA